MEFVGANIFTASAYCQPHALRHVTVLTSYLLPQKRCVTTSSGGPDHYYYIDNKRCLDLCYSKCAMKMAAYSPTHQLNEFLK